MDVIVNNPVSSACASILGGLILIFGYCYWRMWRMYKGLPYFRGEIWLVKKLITNGISRRGSEKTISINHLALQMGISACSYWKSKGFCVLWIVKPFILVFSKDLVKFLINHRACLHKANEYKILKHGIGIGLVTSNGEIWKSHRRIFNKAFHYSFFEDSTRIFNKNAPNLIKHLKEAANGPDLDVLEFVKACSLANICEAALRLDFNDPSKSTEVQRLITLISDISDFIAYRLSNPLLYSNLTLRILPRGRKYLKNLDEGMIYIRKLIQNMKKELQSVETTESFEAAAGPSRKCFAELLLELHTKDPSFTMDDMEGEIKNFIIAGYDTVAHAITWLLFLLGHHPEIQDKVYNEVMSVAEDDLSYSSMQSLKYIECCIKESLRLYPPVPMIARCLQTDVEYENKVLPKGTTIIFFPYVLHRNSEIYPDPEKFDPERFQKENWENCPWVYIPFSEGARNCIGKQFALMEMKVNLVHILRNFHVISLDRKEDVEIKWSIVLSTVKPLRMQLMPRTRYENTKNE